MKDVIACTRARTRVNTVIFPRRGCLFKKRGIKNSNSILIFHRTLLTQSDKRIPLNEVARKRIERESARRDEARVFSFLCAALVAFIVVADLCRECSGNASFFSSFFFPRDARRFGDTTDISFKPVERFLQSGSVAISQTLWRGLLRTRVAELDVRVLRSANAGGCDRV